MKLLRYGAPGAEKPGLLDASGRVRDLSGVIADIGGDALRPEGIKALQALDPECLPLVEGTPQEDLRLGACVGNIGKYICIGLNYADHGLCCTNRVIAEVPLSPDGLIPQLP